jgi:hypothetical protein
MAEFVLIPPAFDDVTAEYQQALLRQHVYWCELNCSGEVKGVMKGGRSFLKFEEASDAVIYKISISNDDLLAGAISEVYRQMLLKLR